MFRRIFVTFIASMTAHCAFAENASVDIPDKAGDFKYGVYHVGFLVDDADEMVSFLSAHSSLRVISRVGLPNGGERLFMSDARGQRVELFTDPDGAAGRQARPQENFTGMAHIAIEADDAPGLKEELSEAGYKILWQAPADFADGYVVSEVDAHRVLFIEGPSGVSVEFFEIKK